MRTKDITVKKDNIDQNNYGDIEKWINNSTSAREFGWLDYYENIYYANAIIDSLHRVADEEFQKPVPKKPGLDELLAWLDANHIPMAVASSSRVHVIEGNLNNWGLTPYFKALVSGQQVKHSKPDPEIFLLAAEKLGTDPAHTLVLEDSYNGVRAGADGGFVTVMVPDLLPADDEMRGLYTMECTSLNEVLAKLKTGEL